MKHIRRIVINQIQKDMIKKGVPEKITRMPAIVMRILDLSRKNKNDIYDPAYILKNLKYDKSRGNLLMPVSNTHPRQYFSCHMNSDNNSASFSLSDEVSSILYYGRTDEYGMDKYLKINHNNGSIYTFTRDLGSVDTIQVNVADSNGAVKACTKVPEHNNWILNAFKTSLDNNYRFIEECFPDSIDYFSSSEQQLSLYDLSK